MNCYEITQQLSRTTCPSCGARHLQCSLDLPRQLISPISIIANSFGLITQGDAGLAHKESLFLHTDPISHHQATLLQRAKHLQTDQRVDHRNMAWTGAVQLEEHVAHLGAKVLAGVLNNFLQAVSSERPRWR